MDIDPIYLVIFVLAIAFVVILLQRVSKPKESLEGMMKGDESDLIKILDDAVDQAGEDMDSFLEYLKRKGVDLEHELKDGDDFRGGWRFWRRRPWRTRRWWTSARAPYLTYGGPYVYTIYPGRYYL